MRAFLFWWRLLMLWTVVVAAVWALQFILSALMLSWAGISVYFPSADREMDEWLHGPRPDTEDPPNG